MTFSLGDYVTVNDRLLQALEKFPDLRIKEGEPIFVTAPDGKVYVQTSMTVYRAWDDMIPMVGYIWEEFPGTTPYTKGSEQPNAATSCLGRILGYMGFGIKKSIASRDDVARRETVKPRIEPVTYPNGDPVPDPFTDQQQTRTVYPPGDATKGQMGKIRGLGRERGVVSNAGLMNAVGKVIGRTISQLDDLSKREASSVIEAWSPEEHLVPAAPPEEVF
jgi:hypothetical protein